jgi:methylenetetrahydrofolate reductase (NADPH)
MTAPAPAERPPASGLERALRARRFALTAELAPPVATDPEAFLASARAIRGLATAVNVTDGAAARAHMSALAAAHFLVQEGIEPVLQLTCRDRNRLALQADLLGAVALGIRNVLVLRGDDPTAGDQPEAKPVFDLATTDLLALADRMRRERRLPPGTPIEGAVPLVLGAAETVVDPAPVWRPEGLLAKVRAGADFVQTQFCMDPGVARRYGARLVELGIAPRVPVLIGVAPIPSARSARWMRDKLFGSVIPETLVERLERAAEPKREGRAICVEMIRALAATPGIAGAHVMAPVDHAGLAEVLRAVAAEGGLGPHHG